MKNAMKLVAGALGAALAAGCAVTAPEVRYYTLDMKPSGGAVPAACSIDIDRIKAADALTRGTILIKLSPTRAEYYASDQWLSRVDEQVTEKLKAEFGPPKEGRPTVVLNGLLVACEQIDLPDGAEGRVRLDVTFSRAAPHALTLAKRSYEARERASSADPDAVVAALSRAVERIAASIAADAAALPPDSPK